MLKKYHEVLFGLLFFAVAMALLFLAAPPIQIKFRLFGLGITELILFATALAGGLAYKTASKKTLKEIFPFSFKGLSFKTFANCLIVYIGSYCVMIGTQAIQMYLFPGSIETSNALNSFFSNGGIITAIITVTVMPGICEEFLHRGFILSTFKNIESTAVKVLLMGIVFGIFHTDIYRFTPTMILGMGLTYIMIKTGNLFYSMLFHFLNNLWGIAPILLYKLINPADLMLSVPSAMYSLDNMSGILSFITSLTLYFPLGLLFIYLGARQFNKTGNNENNENNENNGEKTKRFKFVVPVCLVMAVLSIILSAILSGMSVISGFGNAVYETNISVSLTEPFNSSGSFEIKTERSCDIRVYVDGGEDASGYIRIYDENGKEIYYSGTGKIFNANKPVLLKEGTYTCQIELIPQREIADESEAIPAKAGVVIR